jgi:hypothetical protein
LDNPRRVLFCNRVECRREKELNDFQRNPLDIEILSNLRFGSLEIRDTSVTRVTNKNVTCGTNPLCTVQVQREMEKVEKRKLWADTFPATR